MKLFRLGLTTLLIVMLSQTSVSSITNDEDHIYLNFVRKEVCSNRARKCWPVAFGNKLNPTPFIEGPTYVLTHYRNGFSWRNPFTGQVYKAGTHNLGNIWIEYSKVGSIQIGFHETPYKNIPITQQESKGGCIRMTAIDIKEFSANVKYLDKIYGIREQNPILY